MGSTIEDWFNHVYGLILCPMVLHIAGRWHYNDVIMSMRASQITSVLSVYSNACSGADQRKHQNSASLAFVRGIHQALVNSPHEGPVTWKMFPFDDVIMKDKTKFESDYEITKETPYLTSDRAFYHCLVETAPYHKWCKLHIFRVLSGHPAAAIL